MARARNIKPGFFANDQLAEIEPLGRLLFAGLWTIADREGRLEDRPKKIKAALLPYDDCDIDNLLTALHYAGFISRYVVDGQNYIQIINFAKHQNPHPKEALSIIPAIPIKESEKQLTSNLLESGETITKNTDSPIPITIPSDSPTPITAGQGGSQREPKKENHFNEFWLAYPRKDAKKDAWKAWGQLKPGNDLFVEIMAGLEKAKKSRDWIKDNGQFIPYAATWVRGERWKDETSSLPVNKSSPIDLLHEIMEGSDSSGQQTDDQVFREDFRGIP